ncbi:MAG: class I SAM-dependent methyltransferase [Oligoflexia bacterium]|nr:class I SAM-dependent methyltransferase [Oligoflexia bacterium]
MIELETRHCTLCGPEAGKKVKYRPNFDEADLNAEIFSARRTPDRRHFRLVTCGGCGIIYSDPACDPGRLASLYLQSSVNYSRQEKQIYESYEPVLDRGLKLAKGRGVFLEIGGGTGFMLKYGARHGFAELVEIEPSGDAEAKFAAPAANARFVRGIFDERVFESGALTPGSVSLACFFQMLDHVPDPLTFLRNVHTALEPGGIAVCVTHDTQALSARLLGEKSPIFDIEHTYLFNPTNLSRLFARAGFSGMQAFEVANRYALRYWAQLAPMPRGFKSWLLPSLERLRLADVRIKLNAGNFALIGKKSL